MGPAELKAANVAHFERRLRAEPDPAKRSMILRLLAEERARPLDDYPKKVGPRDAN